MTSALTEASFVTNLEEAYRFRDSARAEQEAGALFHGWHSYVMDMGFGIVKNVYNGGEGGTVWVDNTEWASPFVAVWELFETHDLWVPQSDLFPDLWSRAFFRWVNMPGISYRPRDTTSHEYSYTLDYHVFVEAESSVHPYVAYYRGGPYNATIAAPGDAVHIGDTVTIGWSADVGADSTTIVRIELSRNNGLDGYPNVLLGRDYYDRVGNRWPVGGPVAEYARLRIVASDYAGNADTAYSSPFAILDFNLVSPANPSPAHGSVDVPTQTALAWAPVSGATSYDVYLGLDPCAPSSPLFCDYKASVAAAFWDPPGSLDANTTYWWTIVARYGAAEAWSYSWSFMTGNCVCPCIADPKCDYTMSDVLDVVEVVNSAFRGFVPPTDEDAGCAYARRDVDSTGHVDVIDVVKVVNVAFRGGAISANYSLTNRCVGTQVQSTRTAASAELGVDR